MIKVFWKLTRSLHLDHSLSFAAGALAAPQQLSCLSVLVSPWKLLPRNFCQLGAIREPRGGIQAHILQLCHVLVFFHSSVPPWHFTATPWLLPRMVSWTCHGAESWWTAQILFGATALGQETWTEELTLVVALIYKEALVRPRHELGQGKGVGEAGQEQEKELWDIYSLSLNLAARVLYERLCLKLQLYLYFPFLPVLPTCTHSCTQHYVSSAKALQEHSRGRKQNWRSQIEK